jgi:hypothetical protein
MPLSIHNHIKHYSLHYLGWSICCCCCCAGLGEVTELQTSVVVVMERQWLAVTLLLLLKGSCCIVTNWLLMKKIAHCCSQCRGDGGLAVVARFESKAAHCLKTLLLLTWLSAELVLLWLVVVAAMDGEDKYMGAGVVVTP